MTELSTPDGEPPTCSSRGCRQAALWALVWNNPKLHTPDRRKVWVACPDHRESLGDFLDARGFLRDVTALADLALLPDVAATGLGEMGAVAAQPMPDIDSV